MNAKHEIWKFQLNRKIICQKRSPAPPWSSTSLCTQRSVAFDIWLTQYTIAFWKLQYSIQKSWNAETQTRNSAAVEEQPINWKTIRDSAKITFRIQRLHKTESPKSLTRTAETEPTSINIERLLSIGVFFSQKGFKLCETFNLWFYNKTCNF